MLIPIPLPTLPQNIYPGLDIVSKQNLFTSFNYLSCNSDFCKTHHLNSRRMVINYQTDENTHNTQSLLSFRLCHAGHCAKGFIPNVMIPNL